MIRFVSTASLLALLILRRCFAAVLDPAPPRVQAAVRQAIFSLVVLDAAAVEHEDLIRAQDRRESMRDHERGDS